MEGCTRFERQIVLYLYDELEASEKGVLERHLESCAGCRRALVEQEKLRSLLGTKAPFGLGGTLQESRLALRRILHEQKAYALGRRPRLIRFFLEAANRRPWSFQLAASAAALLVGIALGHFLLPPTLRLPGRMPWQDLPTAISTLADQARSPRNGTPRPTIADLEFLASDPRTGEVTLQFEARLRAIVQGRISEPGIRFLLAAALHPGSTPGTRIDAVEMLAEGPEDPLVRDALIRALTSDENPGVRLEALNALRRMVQDEKVKQSLLRALREDPNPGVRIEAILALSRTSQEGLAPTLRLVAENDPNAYVRALALESLLGIAGTER